MRASDKFNLTFNRSSSEKLDLPNIFSSSDEELRKKAPNRFSGSNQPKHFYLDTPELERGERFPGDRFAATNNRRPSVKARPKAQIITPSYSMNGDNASANSRSSSGSLHKVTKIGDEGRFVSDNNNNDDDDENVDPDNQPFAIPAQFQNDPEFMRSVNYGRPRRPIRLSEKIQLPDISTFSEFETGKGRKSSATKHHRDRISVNSVPIDQTSKAIHSIFGNYVSNAQDLQAVKQSLKDRESKLQHLQEQLYNKNKEFEMLKTKVSASQDLQQQPQQPQMKPQIPPHTDSSRSLRDFFGDSTPQSASEQSVPDEDFATKEWEKQQHEHALLRKLEAERDYYRELARSKQQQQQQQSMPSNTTKPSSEQTFPDLNALADLLSDRLNALKTGAASAPTVPPTASAEVPKSSFLPHSTHHQPAFSKSAPSKKTDRLSKIFSDDCQEEDDDPDKTMRPTVSPQQAATALYQDLKASYDEKYRKMSALVEEYQDANPAYGRRRRQHLQEDLVAITKEVEHDANLIYMLNDMAIAFDLYLPLQETVNVNDAY